MTELTNLGNLMVSLVGNIILLMLLFSPDACMFIHRKWFKWRHKK